MTTHHSPHPSPSPLQPDRSCGKLVAVDPLLLQYTPYVMTETVFTLLLTALLAAITCDCRGGKRQVAVGVLFGLCALCRPTIWPVGIFAAAWWGWRWIVAPPTGA